MKTRVGRLSAQFETLCLSGGKFAVVKEKSMVG